MIQLFIVVLPHMCYSTSLKYYAEQDTLYPDIQSVINNKDLHSYFTNPDSLNLQLIYGWGRDIGMKIPKAGYWIADTLLSIAISNNDHRAIISAYSLRAQMHQLESDVYNSIVSYKKAIHHGEKHLDYKQHPNFDKLAINYVYLGDLYYDIDDIESALKFYKNGWNILKNITPRMIKQQDSFNNQYPRAYTTYRWDIAYSKMKLGMIYTQIDNLSISGIEILKDLYDNPYVDNAIIDISTGYYLGNALFKKENPDYMKYFEEAYSKAKLAKLYNLQSEIGLSILNITSEDSRLDINLANEILDALSNIESPKLKYKTYKILSDYYGSINIALSKKYIDSAYSYREEYYDLENSKYIGKVQSDIEYKTELQKSQIDKDVANYRFYWALSISVIFIIFLIILQYLNSRRKQLLKSLEAKNKLITEQNSQLVDVISSREELIGIIAHDLRNPIKSFRLMSNKLNTTSGFIEIKSGLSDLEDGAIELEHQLNSILEYVQSDLYEPVGSNDIIDIGDAIDKIIKLNQQTINSKNLNISKDLKIRSIISNKHIVGIALSNVIVNAIKFSYEGGDISISSYVDDTFVIINVSDCGIGIEAKEIDKITKQNNSGVSKGISSTIGNGFGLITTINQLEKIGGSLFIESEVGGGTTVLIYLDNCN